MSLQKFRSFFLDSSVRDMKGENGYYYGFGRFRLDVSEQRLSDGESPIPLTPKAFHVLSLLVQNAGHLIEKEELMQRVWPDSFVEESNVAKIVHTLRRRLGDDGDGNSFIETIPTKGYRFVANVELIDQPADEGATNNAGMESPALEAAVLINTSTSTNRRGRFVVLATIVVLIVLVTGFWISNGPFIPRPLTRYVGHSLNGEAYRNFQEGKLLVETPEGSAKALEKFDRAIELDPDYAEAYAGKADAKSGSGSGGHTNDDNAMARASVKKALELNPDSSYAHTVNCRIMGTYDWEFEEAVAECRRAVALDPNDAGAHRELGLALNVVGRSDQGLSELDTAIAISPTSINKRARGIILYMSRHYDEALEQFKQLETTDSNFKDGYKWIMLVSAMKSDQVTAFENLVLYNESLGASPEDISAARSAFETGGWPAAVQVALNAPTGIGTKRTFVVADLFAQIGEKDKALDILREMRKGRALMMVDVPRDPMLEPIRDDPRYNAVLSEMNLK